MFSFPTLQSPPATKFTDIGKIRGACAATEGVYLMADDMDKKQQGGQSGQGQQGGQSGQSGQQGGQSGKQGGQQQQKNDPNKKGGQGQ